MIMYVRTKDILNTES